ncbi:sugar phosphate isomerase/epimerase [Paenibacillus sp. sptzw28]|uniref:sugar phosphate isomerase/epimerase family protein n=1 Tax=Paenibacillus sp. sptzw28 TaxID=715179 RepID=UPI001C6E66BD|nr:sugar phosphate isomerase/epimerase [Paenibacillus sp. sptzw28]QYR24382.1 sugar phosphate isomerase/epimerase [Paenibacillus sp. sptzw28]
MSVGVLAHLLGSLPYRDLAAKVGSFGFRHVQLALWKAVSDIDFSKPGKLSPGLAQAIGEEFDKHGASVSVLGCYLHMFERNEEQRRVNIERFKELLRYARDFGCPTVAFETGVNPGGDYTDRDWAVMRLVLEELAEEAERWGVFIGLEAAHGHLVGTAAELDRMLSEVPSSNIGVVLDPGNLLAEDNFERQDEFIEEAFRLLGSRVIACHAKDRILTGDGRLVTVAPGRGQMNYKLYMDLLRRHKPGVHIIMEAAAESEMPASKSFIETHCLAAAAKE